MNKHAHTHSILYAKKENTHTLFSLSLFASLVTGTVAFAFSAIGILLAGVAISRFKPNARSMVTWNVVVGMVTVCGMLTYSLLGCPVNERSQVISTSGSSGSSIR